MGKDAVQLGAPHPSKGLFVYHDHRCKTATAETAHRLQREATVLCGSFQFHLEDIFQLLDDVLSTFHVAGGPGAYINGMASLGDEIELSVECGNPVEVCEAGACLFCQVLHVLVLEIAELLLGLLEEAYLLAGRVLHPGDDVVKYLLLFLVLSSPPQSFMSQLLLAEMVSSSTAG